MSSSIPDKHFMPLEVSFWLVVLYCTVYILHARITLPLTVWGKSAFSLRNHRLIRGQHVFCFYQSVGFFFKDLLKKTLVSEAITLPLIALVIYIVKIGGEYFYIYAWFTVLVISMVNTDLCIIFCLNGKLDCWYPKQTDYREKCDFSLVLPETGVPGLYHRLRTQLTFL